MGHLTTYDEKVFEALGRVIELGTKTNVKRRRSAKPLKRIIRRSWKQFSLHLTRTSSRFAESAAYDFTGCLVGGENDISPGPNVFYLHLTWLLFRNELELNPSHAIFERLSALDLENDLDSVAIMRTSCMDRH